MPVLNHLFPFTPLSPPSPTRRLFKVFLLVLLKDPPDEAVLALFVFCQGLVVGKVYFTQQDLLFMETSYNNKTNILEKAASNTGLQHCAAVECCSTASFCCWWWSHHH